MTAAVTMGGDDWKYAAGGVVATALAGLIAYAIHQQKKAEWEAERQELQYTIQTLEGEVLSQRDYIGRLESRLLELQNARSRQLDSIANQVDALLGEVEDLRGQVSKESEFYAQLKSMARRLRDLKELAAINQAYPAFR